MAERHGYNVNIWLSDVLGERLEYLSEVTGMSKTKIMSEALHYFTIQFKDAYPEVFTGRVHVAQPKALRRSA